MEKFKFLLLSIMTLTLLLIIAGCSSYEEKEEETVTKVVSFDDLYWIERNQRELADKLIEENKSKTIVEEVQEGASMVRFNLDFMTDHPEYDVVEIEFPVTEYIVNSTTIEFMSDEGVIKRVHSEKDGWKDY